MRFNRNFLAAWVVTAAVLTAPACVQAVDDGQYQIEVSLEGGTGRASIESPTVLCAADDELTATIIWSSANYDYMIVDGEKYLAEIEGRHSVFEIPVAELDVPLEVIADTTAMSTPHEITYSLCFDSDTMVPAEDVLTDQKTGEDTISEGDDPEQEELLLPESVFESSVADRETELAGLEYVGSMDLRYATEFAVDYYEGGYCLVTISGGDRFLTVPEGAAVPDEIDNSIVVLQQPIDNIYLVATSAMDLLVSLESLDRVRLSGTNAQGWVVAEAREAMENGDILYAGKYSAPDYELILSQGCGLSIQSTMIYHSPAVKEKLEAFGIPVLVERSSYEKHPLGRTEWIKMYAALLGKEDLANELFDAQVAKAAEISTGENTGKTVAFFYINSNGIINVRKSTDYVPKMIELAGGNYIFTDLGSEEDNSLSTMNMQLEEFYAGAKDADYIIYNSTIDGEIFTVQELLKKNALLGDFKAVQNGNVWCTGKNLFQESTGLGDMIADIHTMLTTEDEALVELTYLHKLV